jgi:hypothetical protein
MVVSQFFYHSNFLKKRKEKKRKKGRRVAIPWWRVVVWKLNKHGMLVQKATAST